MSFWDKFLGLLGFEEEDEEEEVAADLALEPSARFHPNVVELQPAKNMKLVVLGPKTYDDVQVIADHLRARRPVVVNLEGAQPEVRVRILDFLSGAVYALGGHNQKVSDLIFLLAPTNVDVSNLLEDDLRSQLDESEIGGL